MEQRVETTDATFSATIKVRHITVVGKIGDTCFAEVTTEKGVFSFFIERYVAEKLKEIA
jgi:hypothetical protein